MFTYHLCPCHTVCFWSKLFINFKVRAV